MMTMSRGRHDIPGERPRPPRAEAGFTLVEALASIVILAFGLIAVTNLLLMAGSSNTVANQSTAATVAATEQLELLRRMTWNDPALVGPAPLAPGARLGNVDQEPPPPCCVRDVVIADTAGGELQRVPVQVRWEVIGLDNWSVFIRVRAQAVSPLGRRTRAEFTTVRVCSTCV